MTPEGYVAAKKYMQEIGEYLTWLRTAFSTDGYSLISEANGFKEKEEKEEK